ncbi:glyoxylase-like metal-dependent hydrolase (beta-lactamase superfamily II) [Altererythrobacter atlanticus]|uniref:Hydroxyacylglutathione hydrolase n=1 Tax=Croceibacterium atlanticum TaxID=1267766 RepID=A0A0F7KY05_9SPHN|nr:MBL fold metallo-hydrolase [Croceibacterium atlanticum]AKH44126.1 Hydroxyacylglutathione hydrolase [Croceibacterium atlanticum]MBB5732436.1 glyoxylase-like metal-dependent hydrolase (beta-lactamase superfamily II) [Croceibacterium atlanticum]
MIRLCLAAALLLFTTPAAARPDAGSPPLDFEVLRTSPGSLNVNVALIMGERDAVLVDPPFTLADAHRAVAMVLDSGRNLTHVFVTHDHPDHFFAMEVIQDAFPDAKIVAHPTVVADIWRSLPFKVKRWSPMLGDNGPVHPSAPQALEGDSIMLEGHELKVLGPMQGDHIHATALWAPSIRALFAGDLVFNQMHLWLGEHDPQQVEGWAESLTKLAELGPEVVVAGHSAPGLPDTPEALQFSRRYLEMWPQFVAQAENSAEMRALVRAEFPDAVDALDDFILGNSSKVAIGEEPKWQE